MNIIYFTTAQEEKEYRSFMNLWKISLNSSNQNFHNKLIRALAVNNHVDVISVRPFSHSKTNVSKLKAETKQEGNICWHYLKRAGNKFVRLLDVVPQSKKILSSLDTKNSIIITDTINTALVRSVNKINKKYNLPVIGVCTDSPSNISGTKRSYTMYLLNNTQNFDGYIALTEGLNQLFNPNKKPAYIFEGLVEDRKFEKAKEDKRPYLFFGGALMKRYGVFDLIEAFKLLKNKDIDLYICGHHGNKEEIKEAIKGYSNIKFLGLLTMNKVLEYEANSLACINPRPFSEDLDRFSIPSKTLEYLSSGSPVISVKNTILMDKFKDEIIWVDSARKEDLLKGIQKVLSMSEKERESFGKEAKNRVLKLYSLDLIGENISQYLSQFVKQ